jgi:hypothetical protein
MSCPIFRRHLGVSNLALYDSKTILDNATSSSSLFVSKQTTGNTQMASNIASLEPQQMDELLQGSFEKHPVVVVSPTTIKT